MIRFATTSSLFSASDKSVFSLSSFSSYYSKRRLWERERECNVWSVFVYMSLSLLWCMCVYVVWCLDRNLYHHVLVVVCVYNNRPRDINYIYARCRNNSSIFWIIHTNIKLSSTSASIFLPLLFIQTMCLFLTSI